MFVLHQAQGLLHKLQEYYLQFYRATVVRFNAFLYIIDIIKSALSRRFDGDAVVGSFKNSENSVIISFAFFLCVFIF
jgi:predicted S18 family serine protease